MRFGAVLAGGLALVAAQPAVAAIAIVNPTLTTGAAGTVVYDLGALLASSGYGGERFSFTVTADRFLAAELAAIYNVERLVCPRPQPCTSTFTTETDLVPASGLTFTVSAGRDPSLDYVERNPDVFIFNDLDTALLTFSADPDTTFNFRGVLQAVPEPSTWAMMIAGFGLAGAALRRRHAATGHSAGSSAPLPTAAPLGVN